jgi:hypothetical protein
VGLAGVAKQNGMANGTSTTAGWMPVFIARNGMALVRTGRSVALKKKEKRGRGSVGSGDDGASKWKNLFTVACSSESIVCPGAVASFYYTGMHRASFLWWRVVPGSQLTCSPLVALVLFRNHYWLITKIKYFYVACQRCLP